MTSQIQKTPLKQLVIAVLGLTPAIANADIGGVIEGDFSIYDVSGAYSYGGQFGLSYQSDFGTHYLLGGTFFLEQGDSPNAFGGSFDMDSVGFGLAYRYGFSFKDFEPYIEYGWNNISASYDSTDVFGNPTELESDNSGDYLAVGILYRLRKDLHLKAEIGVFGLLCDQVIDVPRVDIFGNTRFMQDTVHMSGSIGISFKF
jgi:hypothetical protein